MESSPAYQLEPMEEIIGGNVIMRPSPSLYHIFVQCRESFLLYEVREAVKRVHPYEEPVISAIPIFQTEV